MNRIRSIAAATLLLGLLVVVPLHAVAAAAPTPKVRSTHTADAIRRYVRHHIHGAWKLSSGARTWLRANHIRAQFGSDGGGLATATPSIGSNVDANDPSQDIAGGQSETSMGATSNGRLLVGWNDIGGILIGDSTDVRGSVTGVGYSSDGGSSFSDLIGLPNPNANQRWYGDPSVIALDDDHFAVASLYYPSDRARCRGGASIFATAAITIGTVTGGGTSVSFSAPILAVRSGDLCSRHSRRHVPSEIDKEFLSFDPTTSTLAMSYTRYSFAGSGLGQIEVRRAIVPADPATLSLADFSKPVVVWGEEDYCSDSSEANRCGAVNQGSYPAVAPNGDVYVTWERNILSNVFFGGDPFVYIHAAYLASADDTITRGGSDSPVVLTQGQINSHTAGGVKSLDSTFISGYSRGFGNDFPRVAFEAVTNEPVFVWNDASLHPLGDIWLRTASSDLFSLDAIQQVNDDDSYALHMLPALSIGSDGSIRTSWYDRRLNGADSTETDYFAEVRPDASTNTTDFVVTTGPSDWAGTSSLINPNFGDYTDNATAGTTTYFTWSDGRFGVPQPFTDSATVP